MLAGVVVAVALGCVASATAKDLPILRSATVQSRHVVVHIEISDARPVQLMVANRSAVGVDGALTAKNVRVRETIRLAPPAAMGVVRWQSRTKLAPGTYFVQVMAVEAGGGITDCPKSKFLHNCLDRWSNVRKIVVPA